MSLPKILAALLLVALTLALLGALRRVLLWRRGRPARVALLGGLLALPRRYLVDLHAVVASDPYSSRMHVAAAGGFVASLVLIPLAHLPWSAWRAVLPWLVSLALVAMLGGAVAAYLRRRIHPKARTGQLSAGVWRRLPFTLGAYALGCLVFTGSLLLGHGIPDAGPLGWAATLLIVVGFIELFVGLTWGGPMKHAFAGALHLAWHARPARFAARQTRGAASALAPLDLTQDRLGAASVADLPWNRLLGFDACVQCGRCQMACPAFAAGQPLNPKRLILDLAAAMADAPHRPHPVAADTLWACTTCRACVAACPMMIEHVDTVVDLRRFLTLERGATPGQAAAALEELRLADNPGGRSLESRLDWAADLKLPLFSTVGEAEVLLWLGDGAFTLRNQRTLRALVTLLRAAAVDFAVLGAEERDVGDLARRLGDEATFQRLAKANIATLGRYRFQRIVTADPHVLQALRNEYPALGGHFTVEHHSATLAGLIKAGRLKLRAPRRRETVTYHDPCYLARYNGEVEAPRQLLDALGLERREMTRHGLTARCCGGGGGAPLTDVPGERRIPDQRMADARETDAGLVAVACPNCMVMLEGVVEPRPAVKDLAELLAEALEEA